MKKLYYLVLLLLVTLTLQSCIVSQKPRLDFFNHSKYENQGVKFISVNVPMFLAKPIVKKALRDEGESEELIKLIKKVSDIKVMTVENGNEEMIADYAKYLTKNNYEEWMTVKKEKEIIKFQAKQKGEQIRRLLITVTSGTELVYVDVSGKFTADDISKIINYSEKKDLKKLVSH
jgi:hypothetical protein